MSCETRQVYILQANSRWLKLEGDIAKQGRYCTTVKEKSQRKKKKKKKKETKMSDDVTGDLPSVEFDW